MQDAWRAYLELAFGLTEASRKKAREVAKEMLDKGEATAAQMQAFVDDLVATSRTNRDGLVRLVRYEVDRALGAVGLASADEVADLTTRLRELEQRLGEAGASGAAGGHAAAASGRAAVAKKAVAGQPAAKKAAPAGGKQAAKKATGKKATGKKATVTTTGRKAAAKQAPGKKAGGTAAPAGTGRKAAV